MAPNGISAYKLAKEISVPTSRIQDILHGRRKMTADTSVRLGIYFGVSENYFLRMQEDIDIREVKENYRVELSRIKKCQMA